MPQPARKSNAFPHGVETRSPWLTPVSLAANDSHDRFFLCLFAFPSAYSQLGMQSTFPVNDEY